MKFNINSLKIELTATILEFDINGLTDDSISVNYTLYNELGGIVETGTKEIPRISLGVLAEDPIPLDELNTLLSQWDINAISQY